MKNLKEKIANFLNAGPKVSDLAEHSNEGKVTFYMSVVYLTLKRVFHYIAIIVVFGLFLLVGFGGGYALGIVRNEPIPTVNELNKQINHSDNSASLYYAGNVNLTKVHSDTKIDKASDNEITPLVKDAVIATEDENFYIHKGILPKSLVRAVGSELTGIGVQTGGSTLTQQLVKMQFLTSQTTWRRKVTEMFYAHKIEKNFPKDVILRSYLNAAPYGKNNAGENINGIKTAAKGIFGKDISELTLPQVAFIAGLPQSPSIYTPYTIHGKTRNDLSLGVKRKNIVLFRMYRNGAITKKQFSDAKKYNIKDDFLSPVKTKTPKKQNSYLYNLVMNKSSEIIAKNLIQQDGLNYQETKKDPNYYNQYLTSASALLHQKGYQVHTTIRKSLYNEMQTVVAQSNLGQDHSTQDYDQATNKWINTTEHVENGSVMIDNKTGKVLAFSGGVDFKNSQINHAFDTYRSPGSSIKPYLIYAPAIESKIISTRTMLADFPTRFGNYIPTDYNSTVENRFISAQEALSKSYNLPAINLYNKLRKSNINVKDDMKKLGLNLSNDEYKKLGLALGGTNYGFSVADNASAFSNFYNNGNRADSYYIDKITDPTGRVIYQHKINPKKVFSKGTSYIMQHMLHQVVDSGTASSLNGTVQFNTKNLIGKTGTSNDYRDIWFNGSTPGVTISSWMGYDNFYGHSYNLDSNANDNNLALWSNLANALYKKDPSIFKLHQKMKMPSSVRKEQVLKAFGTVPGTINFAGDDVKLKGKKVTALSLGKSSATNPEFGIGATHANYRLFYNYYQGEENDYGQKLLYNGKTISKKHKLDDLFVLENGMTANAAANYYGEANLNRQESSTNNQNVGANDQQAQTGQGGAAGNGGNNAGPGTSTANPGTNSEPNTGGASIPPTGDIVPGTNNNGEASSTSTPPAQ